MFITNHSTGEIKQGTPNQVAQYWATQRQNLALLYRAKTPESTIDIIRSELSNILESSILTYPPTLPLVGLEPELTFQEKKEALGLSNEPPTYTANEQKFLKKMKDSQSDIRKSNWKWRISQEVEEKQQLGWFPFFVTLTVNPSATDPEKLWREGREFRKYIRKLAKLSARLQGDPPPHKKPYRPESNYITYCGVIEHGKSREHHHGHFLIWMKNIPSKWKNDPNKHIIDPVKRTNRECIQMRTYWKWSLPGLSKAYYFRVKGDIWSDIGHGIPMSDKNSKPIPIGGPRQAAAYVTKYIQKEHKEWKHRVKATRNLGMKTLKQVINKLPSEQVKALTWRPNNYHQHHLVSLIHSVPLGLVRLIAKQQHFANQLVHKSLDWMSVMISNSNSFTKMLKSVKAGARPERMPSQDFYDWVCRHLPVQNGYCKDLQINAHNLLSAIFPRVNIQVQPITLGANNIELT